MSRELEFSLLALGLTAAVGAAMGAVDPCLGTGRSCNYVGGFKLTAGTVAIACFSGAIAVSHKQERDEVQAEILGLQQQQYEQRAQQLYLAKQLEADEVLAEERVLAGIGMAPALPPVSQPVVDVAAQPVQQPAISSAPQASAPPVAAPSVPSAAMAQPQAAPSTAQPVALPDGAKLIECSEVANINTYPVVMIVATPGNGKTLTTEYLFSHLPGKKVLCSHKAEAYHRNMFDLVFGYNPRTDESAWIGDMHTLTTSDRDFNYIEREQGGYGTVAQGYWALFADISRRQKIGPSRVAQMESYRDFYDETPFAYATAFKDPLNPESLKWGQSLVSSTNQLVFFDARSNQHQIFFAAQSDSVDIIGLKGLSEARDEMWFLYPGPAAIAYATQKRKTQLANWLQSRFEQGYAVAILVKQDVFWQVLNLPKVADLITWENQYKTVPTQSAPPVQTETATIYDLVREQEHAA